MKECEDENDEPIASVGLKSKEIDIVNFCGERGTLSLTVRGGRQIWVQIFSQRNFSFTSRELTLSEMISCQPHRAMP